MAQEDKPDTMLTLRQVAGELNISLNAVYNLIYSDNLRAVNLAPTNKPGDRRFWRVPRRCLTEFLEARLTPGKQPTVEQQTRHRAHPQPIRNHLGL